MHPEFVGNGSHVFVVEVYRIEQLSIDIELELIDGVISDPNGPRALVTLKMAERGFGQVLTAIDAIDGLQRAVRLKLATKGLDPFHKPVRLIRQSHAQQPVNRESRIANPAVAVIPVALAAGIFRQTAGRRGHDRAGRLISQQLEYQR